jgi:hypothetical protein
VTLCYSLRPSSTRQGEGNIGPLKAKRYFRLSPHPFCARPEGNRLSQRTGGHAAGEGWAAGRAIPNESNRDLEGAWRRRTNQVGAPASRAWRSPTLIALDRSAVGGPVGAIRTTTEGAIRALSFINSK